MNARALRPHPNHLHLRTADGGDCAARPSPSQPSLDSSARQLTVLTPLIYNFCTAGKTSVCRGCGRAWNRHGTEPDSVDHTAGQRVDVLLYVIPDTAPVHPHNHT